MHKKRAIKATYEARMIGLPITKSFLEGLAEPELKRLKAALTLVRKSLYRYELVRRSRAPRLREVASSGTPWSAAS